MPSFVDYFIHTELSLNADGFKRSAYFFKDKDQADGTGSKMQAGSVWDYNLAYGNCNSCNANPVAFFAAYQVKSYQDEIYTVKGWFRKRLSFLDREWGYEPG